MMKGNAAVWAIAVAFIVNGLVTWAVPDFNAAYPGMSWIVAGIAGLLVGWMGKKE